MKDIQNGRDGCGSGEGHSSIPRSRSAAAPRDLSVKFLLDDVKAWLCLNVAGSSGGKNATASNTLSSMFPAGSASPLSPRSTSGSPHVMKRGAGAGPSSFGSPLKVVSREPMREVIPQFYFKNGQPPSVELEEQFLSRINELFYGYLNGLQVQVSEFKSVTKEICKLPSFFSTALFQKIDVDCIGIVTRDAFVDYWINSNMITMDTATQIFRILKQPDRRYLTQEDFKPVLRELLASHLGLEFLQSTPEFQEQ